MRRSTGASFRLLHAMILVAMIAFGIAAARAQLARGGGRWAVNSPPLVHLFFGGFWFVPFLALALVAIEKLSGTPWRRLARRPGPAACIAILLNALALFANPMILALIVAARRLERPRIDLPWCFDTTWIYLPYSAPYAVGASWLILSLTGRWRLGRSWVDRCGLLCGFFFITWQWLFSALC